ncbi:TPA: hypothetical protein RNY16_002192 [Pasteurella multocida]|nr:hypothetical protein [Pasteurella multocida]
MISLKHKLFVTPKEAFLFARLDENIDKIKAQKIYVVFDYKKDKKYHFISFLFSDDNQQDLSLLTIMKDNKLSTALFAGSMITIDKMLEKLFGADQEFEVISRKTFEQQFGKLDIKESDVVLR